MAERDRFELDLTAALRAYAEDAPTQVRPAELARRLAVTHPHRRAVLSFWPPVAVARPAQMLLLAGLLLAALLGSTLLVGAWRDDPISVAPPTSPSPGPAADESPTLLATTRARALPPAATCPTGTDPDAPGPAGQARPPKGPEDYTNRAMAFDRRAGRIVLLADRREGGSRTWTFDVCANTWQDMSPSLEPPILSGPSRTWLVYDADSDRTVALVRQQGLMQGLQVWSYDLSANRWTHGSDSPVNEGVSTYGVAYHDPSGLVVTYDGNLLWAYDVDRDRWAVETQRPDPPGPSGLVLPSGFLTLAYDSSLDLLVVVTDRPAGEPEAWTFDPGTRTWARRGALPPDLQRAGDVGSRTAVFDESTGWTALFSIGGVRVEGYHAGRREWAVLNDILWGPTWCDDDTAVYDSLNGRIVCREIHGVTAFTTTDGAWQFLLNGTP